MTKEMTIPRLSDLQQIKVGDTVKFTVLIAYRRHTSTSKVYGVKDNILLISCNGIKKEFQLRLSEVIGIYKTSELN